MKTPSSTLPIKVFLIEDHFVVRQGLKQMLELRGVRIVGEAESAEPAISDLIKIPKPDRPDVIILDLTLPNVAGVDAIHLLKDTFPDTKILVFSMRSNPHTVAMAYRAGVLAYVTKDAAPEVLLEALTQTRKGEVWVMPALQRALALHAVGHDSRGDPRTLLTARELEIFIEMARGLEPKKVAEMLNIVESTLSKRIFDIRRKLQCERTDFHRIATEFDLLE